MAVSEKSRSPANAPPGQSESTRPPHQLPETEAAAPARYRKLAVYAFLVLGVGLVFTQTVRFSFVNFDDQQTVYGNPDVTRGLSVEGIWWAFTHGHFGNWIPLTCLSHMLDCQINGLHAGGHHMTNVLLHAATAVLLFLVLRRMTDRFWPSAAVAALFAVHPLRVESVAWVTERKDVLSGLFFMLTLAAYVGYARHRRSLLRYLVVMALFTCGLWSKPMLVTLPLVLLLLDYWPLGRLAGDPSPVPASPPTPCPGDGPTHPGTTNDTVARRLRCLGKLMLEKVPLVLLAAIFCGVTLRTQSDAIAMSANEAIPLVWRIANALVSYVAYLEQAVFPAGMAVFYPHLEDQLPMQRVFLALAVLVLISAAAVVCRRRCPYVLMGWLWYLVMLVPVSGVVQTGWHARGDRFTYLPQIGLCMALVWGARDLCRSSWSRRWAGGLTAALVLAVLMGCAWRQTSFWCDSETLWTHALACTEPHELPHGKLGLALAERGQFEAAIAEYQKALEIKSANFEIRNNLSVALMALGRFDEAIPQSQEALRLAPGTAEAHFNLAFMLGRRSRFDEAVAHYRQGLEIAPGDAKAHFYLGKALAHGRRFGEAIAQFEQAVQLNPEDVDARLNLAWLRATCGAASLRDGAAAIEHAQRAMQLCGGQRADVFDALAAGYAEAGRFAEAIVAARRALELAAELKVPVLTNAARARLALYEAGHPLHQGSSAAPRSP